MDYKNCFVNKIITRVMDKSGHEINVSRLAQQINKPVPSVWNKVSHRRRWDAETWLQTLFVLGYAKTDKQGRIVISANISNFEANKLRNLRTNDVFVIEE